MNAASPHDFRHAYQATTIDPSMPVSEGEMEVELASPWARMGAYIINSLISVVVMIPLLLSFVPAILSGNSNFDDSLIKSLGIGMGISLLLGLGLLVWQLVWMIQRGQSIGKRILGIKVVTLNGENPGFVGTVLMREVVYYLIILVITFIIGALLGVIFAVGGHLDAIDRYSFVFDLLGYIPTIICVVMLFRTQTLRRTLQDYLAKTLVIKA